MFQKYGSIFTILQSSIIKTAETWTDYIASHEKKSLAQGVIVHRRQDPSNDSKVVCDIDPDRYIYIHTTIMASVDTIPNSHYITKETEKYINNNGDSWPREQLLKDYFSFVEYGNIYVEHDQNPERAKGKVLDAIARDMSDTILIDLLFCVDKIHKDLVHNIETGIANAVSMGCSTKYTVCSICGNIAHDEKEYCEHIRSKKNQFVRCADGVYRKVAELCYDNTFFDCSIVANPAFAGAVFRKLVGVNKVSMQLLANVLTRQINTGEFENEITKIASKVMNMPTEGQIKTADHPIDHEQNSNYPIMEPYADIPYRDPHNILKTFDDQQPKDQKVSDIGKKASDERGQLVYIKETYPIPSHDRKASFLFNHIAKDTVGRIVGKNEKGYAIYFPKLGMVKNIPSSIIASLNMKQELIDAKSKTASKVDDELVINRKGFFNTFGERFQVLDVKEDDVEVRWLTGHKMGQKEKLSKAEFRPSKVKWASTEKLASFDAFWDSKTNQYQLKIANWNEKQATVLDTCEDHIDNVQEDILSVMPQKKGKYTKSFVVRSCIDNINLKFNASIDDNNLKLDVTSTIWE